MKYKGIVYGLMGFLFMYFMTLNVSLILYKLFMILAFVFFIMGIKYSFKYFIESFDNNDITKGME